MKVEIERISSFKFGSLHLYHDTGLDNFRFTLFSIVSIISIKRLIRLFILQQKRVQKIELFMSVTFPRCL